MNNLTCIKQACPSDCDTIVELGKQTFIETYGEVSPKASLEKYLSARFSPQKIESELSNPRERFFIAYQEDVSVGFTKMRDDRQAKNLNGRKSIELERIYVLKEHQGSRVGKELMQQCKEFARQEGFETIWLQVWQQNLRAIQFYQKAGFVIYETTSFSFDEISHNDFLMRYDLYY
jgi:ribosomal protein S18 acetylase RimI-like enzyme